MSCLYGMIMLLRYAFKMLCNPVGGVTKYFNSEPLLCANFRLCVFLS